MLLELPLLVGEGDCARQWMQIAGLRIQGTRVEGREALDRFGVSPRERPGLARRRDPAGPAREAGSEAGLRPGRL